MNHATADTGRQVSSINPVFIFGSPRSGTTLTFNCLGFHKQILQLSTNTYFFEHFWNLRRTIPPKALYKLALFSSGLDSTAENNVAAKPLADALFKIIVKADSASIDPVEIYNLIVKANLLSQHRDHASVIYWADRTNNYVFHYRTLRLWFPRCKFIFCVRDPRSVITAQLNVLHKKKPLPSLLPPCIDFTIHWIHRNSTAFAMQELYGEDVFINRYEDFVTTPVEHMNKIWKFLNLAQMGTSELQDKIEGLGPIYRSKTGVERFSGIDTRSVESWKTFLPSDAQWAVEDLSRDTAVRFGYVFTTARPLIVYLKRFPSEKMWGYIVRVLRVLISKYSPFYRRGL